MIYVDRSKVPVPEILRSDRAASAEDEGRPAEEILREEIRLTVLHELGHFFGMEEDQLEDV